MAKVKTKKMKTGLDKFNFVLAIVLIALVVATALIIIFSSPKVPVDDSASSSEFVDKAVIDEFVAGTYGGKSFETQDDVINYYNECYNYTKTLLADYTDTESGSTISCYKLVGEETLDIANLLVEGKSNSTLDSLAPGIVSGLFSGGVNGLPPSGGKSPSSDFRADGTVDQTTSHFLPEDAIAANVKDNGDGTIDITIQPKACYLSMSDQDAQGRFFNVLGDISGTVESISILSFSEGTIEENFVVNYHSGTGVVTIDTATGEITKGEYVMNVHIDVQHANVTVLKDKNASLDIIYTCKYPASDEYLAERNMKRN